MIIIMSSQKGGSGKSTIGCNLAAHIANVTGDEVAIVDTDEQGTASNWTQYRGELPKVPQIQFFQSKPGAHLIRSTLSLAAKFKYVLVDLQGADTRANFNTLNAADVIIFPFKPSQPDLDTLATVKENAESIAATKPDVKILYVINEAPTHKGNEKDEALAYFSAWDVAPLSTIVHSRKAFRESMSKGLGVFEMGDEKAKAEIAAIWDEIQPSLKAAKSRRKQTNASESASIS